MNAFHLLARAMRASRLDTMRLALRSRRFLLALVAAGALAGGLACGDSPTGLIGARGDGKLRVHAAVGPTIQTMVSDGFNMIRRNRSSRSIHFLSSSDPTGACW